MAATDVKLLGQWQSPFVIRVQMALKLKSIEHEFVETDPYNKNELLLKANPVHKKIPVLIHADRPICESLVIVQYIDDVWTSEGPSILPSDPYQRSLARFWAAYVDDKLVPLLKELKEAKENDAKKGIIEKMCEVLVMLEGAFVGCSEGKGFFGGDNVGYVDIVLGCYLGWIRAIEILMDVKYFDETSTPGLMAWAERLCSDSIVKDVIPSAQKIIDFNAAREQAKSSLE